MSSRVSKAGRYTEIQEQLQEEINKKILESQDKFTTQWRNATGTSSKLEQLDRIQEGQIDEVLTYGYPNTPFEKSGYVAPTPEPEPTPQPTIRTTKFGESVSTTPTPQPRLTTYYMKSPSGLCRQVSISADGKKKLESTGHIFSKNNICELEPQPTPPTTPPTTTTPPPPEVTIIPEIPEVSAEQQVNLSDDIIQILNDIESGVILVPDWFKNNIDWVKNGHISQQEFRTAYNYLIDQQIVHPPEEPTPLHQEPPVNAGMVLQSLDNFQIINGRLTGRINFKASETFDPYYYNADMVNYLQISTETGKIFRVKENILRFGISNNLDLVETIHYDESIDNLTKVKVESFVWTSYTKRPISSKLSFTVDTETGITEEAKTGFMGAGFALSAIAISIALGFIIDIRGRNK